jgi:hypothetical protein
MKTVGKNSFPPYLTSVAAADKLTIMNGDISLTDPVCSKSPQHAVVLQAIDSAKVTVS